MGLVMIYKTRRYQFKKSDGTVHPMRAFRIGPFVAVFVRLKNFQEIK